MEYKLKQRLLSYLMKNECPNKEERELIAELMREMHQYDVLSISKKIFHQLGYHEFDDCSHEELLRIADTMKIYFEGTYLPVELEVMFNKNNGLC